MHTLEIHISAALQTDLSRAFQNLHTDSDLTSHRNKNNPGYVLQKNVFISEQHPGFIFTFHGKVSTLFFT